jgi:hypothetical protein
MLGFRARASGIVDLAYKYTNKTTAGWDVGLKGVKKSEGRSYNPPSGISGFYPGKQAKGRLIRPGSESEQATGAWNI